MPYSSFITFINCQRWEYKNSAGIFKFDDNYIVET